MAGKDNDDSGIMDILDTPDVAVWAKGISKKGTDVPSDRVREPSKIASMTLHTRTKKGESLMVDPANKQEMAKVVAAAHAPLTDESEYAKQE